MLIELKKRSAMMGMLFAVNKTRELSGSVCSSGEGASNILCEKRFSDMTKWYAAPFGNYPNAEEVRFLLYTAIERYMAGCEPCVRQRTSILLPAGCYVHKVEYLYMRY
jgi:hypothetical protein